MPLDRTSSSTERAAQERRLMDDYVRGTGQDPQLVRARTDEAARMLLKQLQSRQRYGPWCLA